MDTAFESWFRVEVAMTLLTMGYRQVDLRYNVGYPLEPKKKADFAFGTDSPIVFELKILVKKADANKLEKLPSQVASLEEHILKGSFGQAVVFVTFFGYSSQEVSSMLARFFSKAWQVSGPHALVAGKPLEFAVAALTHSP